jgi:hypothetical protein
VTRVRASINGAVWAQSELKREDRRLVDVSQSLRIKNLDGGRSQARTADLLLARQVRYVHRSALKHSVHTVASKAGILKRSEEGVTD